MSKKEKNQNPATEETPKKKRIPRLVIAEIVNKDGSFEEMEFESKSLVKNFVQDECKGKFRKDGFIDLKDGGKVRFIIQPSWLVFQSQTVFKECSVVDL